jgi:uncharacterized protein YecE (DUF72 family)
VGVIRIGTCSWNEKSLVESGVFYPPDVVSAEQRLRFYSSRFDTVEVQSSFYSIPTLHMTQAWTDRAPEKFLFHVKAYAALTGHSINPSDLPEELRAMLPEADRDQDGVHVSDPDAIRAMARALVDALAPLKNARKLGFIIFQFPPWFTHKKANREYLLYCKEMMGGLPIAVEFRHGSWLTRQHAQDVFSFLMEHKISYITCDEPQYGTLETVPFLPERTTCIGYLRLHGRNTESWEMRSEQRYQYRYDDHELRSIASAARRLSQKTRITFVMFNNCHGGHAMENALRLRELLVSETEPDRPLRPEP